MKTEILVATHKPISLVDNDIFRPIQVGRSIHNFVINESYYFDDDGENISGKNVTFNELTALYWAWKNLKDVEVFGLMHYRRFLDLHYKKPFFKKEKIGVLKKVDANNKNFLKLDNVDKTKRIIISNLNKYEVLLAKPAFCSINGQYASIADDYKKNHISKDWDICIEVIEEKFPDYRNSIENFLYKSNKFYIGNMFIAKKKWFDNFCKWLFTILFEVEKRIDICEDSYQKRVIGFLSERLFTLYILHNNFKLKEFPILFIEN